MTFFIKLSNTRDKTITDYVLNQFKCTNDTIPCNFMVRLGHDRMVACFTTTYAINVYHH